MLVSWCWHRGGHAHVQLNHGSLRGRDSVSDGAVWLGDSSKIFTSREENFIWMEGSGQEASIPSMWADSFTYIGEKLIQ